VHDDWHKLFPTCNNLCQPRTVWFCGALRLGLIGGIEAQFISDETCQILFGSLKTKGENGSKRIVKLATGFAEHLKQNTTQERLLLLAKTMLWRLSNQPIFPQTLPQWSFQAGARKDRCCRSTVRTYESRASNLPRIPASTHGPL